LGYAARILLQPQRLMSLDVYRQSTIGSMQIFNNADFQLILPKYALVVHWQLTDGIREKR